jgi:lipoyl(octanoyl) transferase
MTNEKLAALKQPHAQTGVVPDVAEAMRGGQTTAHMPGQLTAYPIFDLKAYDLSPRCYVHLLETSIIQTLAQYGIAAKRTSHTGVWVSDHAKIAAIGVHLRRNITSHGIALNIHNDLSWFNRIVACGLADKQTTSMEKEGRSDVAVQNVTAVWVKEMAALLKVDSVLEELHQIQP